MLDKVIILSPDRICSAINGKNQTVVIHGNDSKVFFFGVLQVCGYHNHRIILNSEIAGMETAKMSPHPNIINENHPKTSASAKQTNPAMDFRTCI
jgi:hypothetical protein